MAERGATLQHPAQFFQNASHFQVQNSTFNNITGNQSITNNYIQSQQSLDPKMVKWLDAPDPKTNFMAARDKITKGTGMWILQHISFLEWKSNGHILWIQGKAGSGKTFLCTMMIESICKDTSQFFYHYFDTRDSKKCHYAGLISSVFSQLTTGMNNNNALRKLYEKSQKGKLPPNSDDLGSAILDIMKSIQSTLYIVIDAMDECVESQRTMGFLQKLLSLENIFILVTSRYQNTFQVSKNFWEISIIDGNVNPDIETHINHALTEFKHLPSSLNSDIKDILVKEANGQIRWVDCQLTVLKSLGTPKAIRRALKSLPDTLEETYTQALQRISIYHQEDAKHILEWIIFSLKPVSTDMIREVLAIDIDEKTFVEGDRPFEMEVELHRVLDSTLIAVTAHAVQLAHPSVKDFLIGENIRCSTVNSFYMNNDLAQQFIAKCCLIYILHFGKNVESPIDATLCPLAMYAAQNWMNHAREHDNDDVHNLCLDILDPQSGPYINWLCLYQPDNPWRGQSKLSKAAASPVYYASAMGMKYLIESLMKDSTDLETIGGLYGYPLHVAARFGHKEIVDMILNNVISINTIFGDTFDGGTALTLASKYGHEAVARLLLSRGADTNLVGGHYHKALHAASSGGNLAIVELLLDKGADINFVGGYHGTALHVACNQRNLAVVELLLNKGADINFTGGYYGTALQAACCGGNLAIVELMLEKGAEINLVSGHYGTALQAACYGGNLAIVELMFEKGAEINFVGGHYSKDPQAAYYIRNWAIVELLFEKGADIKFVSDHYGTLLQDACLEGNLGIVELLLEKGADINFIDDLYGTALQAACNGESLAIVELLLEKGADINLVGGHSGTALQVACYRENLVIVELLLQKGADINFVGGDHLQAACYTGNLAIVELMLEKGAEINLVSGHYGTALQAACCGRNLAIIELMLEKGAEINLVGGHYGTGLQAACYGGNLAIVELLLEQGADINLVGGDCGTALHAALQSEHFNIANLLLDSGADINAINPEYHCGGTPLKTSAEEGLQNSVKFLLKKGADVNLVYDGFLSTALQAASYDGSTSIVQLLLSHGADVNTMGGFFGTALNSAVFERNEEIVKILLNEGAEVNVLSKYHRTTLDMALLYGRESIVPLLLNNGGEQFGFFTWMVQNDRLISLFDIL